MKFISNKLMIISFAVAILFALSGCGSSSTPIVSVVTSASNSENGASTYSYYQVFDNGKAKKAEAFTPDNIERLDALHDNFSPSISGSSVVNTLQGTLITDQDGNEVPADSTLTDILTAAADEIKHDIIQFDILKDGESYFTVVKLNVNWQSPCELYQYDQNTRHLNRLYRGDSVDIVGIALA